LQSSPEPVDQQKPLQDLFPSIQARKELHHLYWSFGDFIAYGHSQLYNKVFCAVFFVVGCLCIFVVGMGIATILITPSLNDISVYLLLFVLTVGGFYLLYTGNRMTILLKKISVEGQTVQDVRLIALVDPNLLFDAYGLYIEKPDGTLLWLFCPTNLTPYFKEPQQLLTITYFPTLRYITHIQDQ